MIIVAGSVTVDPAERAAYLESCVDVVRRARGAPGCLDFALSADLLDPGRVNVFECWESRRDLDEFRGEGPSDDQQRQLLGVSVEEYDLGET
jgi:quinol monooxygenase YgiN